MSIFNSLPVNKPKLTPFNLSHSVKFSTQFGFEQPVACEKVVPGDVVLDQVAHRVDFAPLTSKLFQEFRIKSESFFVPTRILWKQFEDFFVEEENNIVHPYLDLTVLYDAIRVNGGDNYFPTSVTSADVANAYFSSRGLLCAIYGDVTCASANKNRRYPEDALALYAYFFIMKEYYLDENLQDDFIQALDPEIFLKFYQTDSGDMTNYFANLFLRMVRYNLTGIFPDMLTTPADKVVSSLSASVILQYSLGFVFRNYPKDYFVGALPWKQKGNTVYIPTSSRQEVQFYIQNDAQTPYGGELSVEDNNNAEFTQQGYKGINLKSSRYDSDTQTWDNSYMKAYTAIGSGVTSIEDFRTAYQVQQWLERNARGGTRYKEQILAHFGIKTKDSRLDRPEFVFGVTDVVNHGNIFTTFQNEAGDGVPGEQVSHLTAGGRSKSVSYRVTEHGYYFSLYCIFPKAAYMHGLFRQRMELDKFDYFWPEFEHLGEQEVYKCELFSNVVDPKATFGYVPRYSQYKHRDNIVRGEFVTNLPTFTLSRDWRGANLNSKFIQIDPFANNLNRCFNVVNANYDKIYMEVFNGLYMLRPMSYYGIPRLVL